MEHIRPPPWSETADRNGAGGSRAMRQGCCYFRDEPTVIGGAMRRGCAQPARIRSTIACPITATKGHPARTATPFPSHIATLIRFHPHPPFLALVVDAKIDVSLHSAVAYSPHYVQPLGLSQNSVVVSYGRTLASFPSGRRRATRWATRELR